MQLKIFSVRDSKGQVFNTPFFQRTHGEAERSFRELANDPKSMINKYPDDYDLYFVGEYDDQTGVISPQDTPQHVLKAVSALVQGNHLDAARIGANSVIGRMNQ